MLIPMTTQDRNAPPSRPSVEAYRRAEAGRIALLSLLAAVDYTVHQYQAGKLPNLTLGELRHYSGSTVRVTPIGEDQ